MHPNSPEARDIAYHLHPLTNPRRHMEMGPLVLDRGEGVYVYDGTGKRYIEAMSGLWSVAVGFGERRLVDAAARQMERLAYGHSFYGRSHGPVIDLAEKLVKMAPVPMSRAFFTSSGSEANDTVMKMVWYRSNALGQPRRKKIIAREGAYHGTTIGSGSLTGLGAFHNSFDLPIANVVRTGNPHYFRYGLPGESEEQFAARRAEELDRLIQEEGAETIAAFIGEPVLGAGGVVVPPGTYWAKIQAVLKKYDILLIADEVVTGFGRTGNMFGSQTYDIQPDIMVLSKALSSSYLPIAAVLINERIFAPIVEEADRNLVFGHGLTGGGHPVAAAVALENIRLIEERDLVANAAQVGEYLRAGLTRLSDHPLVVNVRGVGLIAAIELAAPGVAPGLIGRTVMERMIHAGVIVRALADAVGFCPPLIITREQVDQILSSLKIVLDEVHAELRKN